MKKIYSLAKSMAVLALLGAQSLSAQTYCSSQASSTGDDEIFNVTLGSLNNTSNCSQTGGPGSLLNRYSNYTTIVPAPILMMGMNYPASITAGQCGSWAYSGYLYIWIDWNQNGTFTDPGEQVYMSPYSTFNVTGSTFVVPGGVTIPFSATPGTTRMRVTCVEGTTAGPCSSYSWGETEDYNVNIISPVPCSGIPGANSVITPTYEICPNAAVPLSLATQYTVGGISYAWQTSTVSNVGPWTPVPNATMASMNTPTLNQNTYYSVVITCSAGNGSVMATAGQVSIQPTVISTIPYFEGFEGISNNNQLPNCSWTSTNPNTITRTYTSAQSQQRVARTGNKFGSFNAQSSTGSHYFYTNGIQMEAGVTYSASVWFATNYYGDMNWSDLSILVGPSQSTTGLVSIASTNGPAASSSYKSLANTFTVATSGVYYVAIRGTNLSTCCAYHLNWDDLLIEAPCALNTPTVSASASSSVVCAGENVVFTAFGADTYLWSNGQTGSTFTEAPTQSGMYSVVGTSTASGCPATASQYITVNPVPSLAIFSDKQVVCAGKPAVLSVQGANTYTWNINSNSNFVTVNPNTTTTYSVFGANQFNCVTMGVITINVNPNPTVTASADRSEICNGESASLSGNGAVSYQWAANTLFVQAPVAIVSPKQLTTYTVTGTDANGCTGMNTIVLSVSECVGLKEMTTTLAGVKVYPNPTGGVFSVELANGAEKLVQVLDVTGRVVKSVAGKDELMEVNISELSAGIYHVKIQSENAVEVIKIVKN